MAEFITQRELRNHSGEIMRRLDQGESLAALKPRRCGGVRSEGEPGLASYRCCSQGLDSHRRTSGGSSIRLVNDLGDQSSNSRLLQPALQPF
jgi:hypothetical protein